MSIEPTYPSFSLTDEQLGTLMGTGAIDILNKEGAILVRIVMVKAK